MSERPPIFLAAGLRTPFVRVDGPFARRDALALSVPVVQAMARQASGPIDFAVWGWVVLNLAYSNLAREVWLEAGLDPHVPEYTTIMQCSTSMVAAFQAAGLLSLGPHGLALVGGVESMSRVQIGLGQNVSDWIRRVGQGRGLRRKLRRRARPPAARPAPLRAGGQESRDRQEHGRALRGDGPRVAHREAGAGRVVAPEPSADGRGPEARASSTISSCRWTASPRTRSRGRTRRSRGSPP